MPTCRRLDCGLVTAPARKLVIGLLGAPGSGKSTIAGHFARLGCGVIDADVLAKEALDEPAVRDQLVAWWGERSLGEGGRVDRKAVASIVFDDAQELAKLEGVVHPRVHAKRQAIRDRFDADPAIVAIVEDVPLLLEKNLRRLVDVLVFVDAPREVRLNRVAATRGWTDEELARREKSQLSLDFKRAAADHVIDNSGGEAVSFEQVRRLLSRLLQPRA